MNKLLINTPQNVNFEYKLASLGSRILAFAIDYAIIVLYLVFIYTLILKSSSLSNMDDWSIWAIFSLATLPIIFYTLLTETLMSGQTFGKKIMKIKVVKIDGTRATIYQYFIRWVFNIVDIFMTMGGIGITSIILTPKSQRIGDIAADTAVISTKEDISLDQTIFQNITAEYTITYPEVIKLSDKDINEIKEIYDTGYKRKDYKIIQILAAKIESLLGLTALVQPDIFIKKIIQDHYYMFRDQ